MKSASRQRQESFAKSFDGVQALDWRASVDRFVSRHGLSWLTDEQMEEIASDMVCHARRSQWLRIRNRAALRRAS